MNSLGKAGFLFPGGGRGSGATITGFSFHRVAFPVFSRGADEVSVTHNSMWSSIQAVTNWANGQWGRGWSISHNEISHLRTSCGGGIGILVGDYAGGVLKNRVVVSSGNPSLVSASAIEDNRIDHNYVGPGGHHPDRALSAEKPAGAAPVR